MINPLENKLKEIFDTSEHAAEIVEKHPGQNFDQIKKTFELNVSAHISTSNHVGLFVYNVLNRKGDLKTLADAAAKRIVLSDARVEAVFQNLPVTEKAARAEKIYNIIVVELTSFFEQLKGKNLDQNTIIESLTSVVSKKISETLNSFGKAG